MVHFANISALSRLFFGPCGFSQTSIKWIYRTGVCWFGEKRERKNICHNLDKSVCLGFLDWVMPPMMKSLIYFSIMDHTHIQRVSMPTVSAAPHGLCEICRGCVGDRHVQFDVNDTGNKPNPSRQIVWWLCWHTEADHCDEARKESSPESQIISALVFVSRNYSVILWVWHFRLLDNNRNVSVNTTLRGL